MRILLLFLCVGLSTANEHWFIFDLYQFPGFYTPLLTLNSSSNHQQISLALSTYDRAIIVDINSNESFKLNIQRADLISNTLNHMIFIVIKNQTRFESYVNCKLIDSYLLYSSINDNSSYNIKITNQNIEYYQITSENEYNIFETFSCKQKDFIHNSTSIIGQSLIHKMQHVIEKVQQRKLRSRRQNNQPISSNSFTIIYNANINQTNTTIFNIPELKFHIQYSPSEHLFTIQFNRENRTQFVIHSDKPSDRLLTSKTNLVIFLHITSTMITSYVNCELTDQEYITDSFYIENVIEQIINNNKYEYNRQSTLILFNKSIDQIANEFFCSKLDKKNEELLPEKYALRKFTNALDMLVNSLDRYSISTTKTQNISAVNIPSINGFGSLKIPSLNSNYDQNCLTDEDCNTKGSSMKCQLNHCICPKRLFWSSISHRCVECHDLLIGNRCFRLSNHKSRWYDANEYCQEENNNDEGQEYSMKLASNLNQTDIQYLKQSFDHDHEHIDYMYWIGATSHYDTKKLNYRIRRELPLTTFRWYDNNQFAQINFHDIWCSQMDYNSLTTINNNQLCVSLSSCGLYADDCQRNYRFICEAV